MGEIEAMKIYFALDGAADSALDALSDQLEAMNAAAVSRPAPMQGAAPLAAPAQPSRRAS